MWGEAVRWGGRPRYRCAGCGAGEAGVDYARDELGCVYLNAIAARVRDMGYYSEPDKTLHCWDD